MTTSNSKYTSTKIACYAGYFVQAIINNLASLFYVIFQDEFGLNYSQISWLILINFVSQIFIDFASVKVIEKVGYRISIVFAHAFACAGLILLGILPRAFNNHFIGLVIPIIIYAIGSGLIEVLISPIIEGLPLSNKSGEMAFLHSFYCWGQASVVLITTFSIKLIGTENWIYMPMLWAVIPLFNLFAFMRVPIVPPVPEGESEMKIPELFREPTFIICALLMLCAGASEIAMAQWASAFAEKSLGVSKFTGDLLGPCLFAVLMGSGRVLYGSFGDRLNLRRVLSLCASLCIISYLMTSLVPIPLVSLVGCGLCGLSASTMWPGIFSLSAKAFPKGGTAMFAMLAMFGDFGCAFGPWITGILSDAAQASPSITMDPLKFGLIFCIAFPILMIILLNFTKSMKKVK